MHRIERKNGTADILRMKVNGRRALQVRFPDDSHAKLLHTRSVPDEIVRLQDHHVPTVPAPTFDQASSGSVGAPRRNHFQEGVPDR